MFEDSIFRCIISTVMLKIKNDCSDNETDRGVEPQADTPDGSKPLESMSIEILNENIRNYLLQYPLSIEAVSDQNMSSDLQMKSKVMEIH